MLALFTLAIKAPVGGVYPFGEYTGIFMRSPSLNADLWPTMPGTVYASAS